MYRSSVTGASCAGERPSNRVIKRDRKRDRGEKRKRMNMCWNLEVDTPSGYIKKTMWVVAEGKKQSVGTTSSEDSMEEAFVHSKKWK